MSKVEEFYNALIKDPDLDIKPGQTRKQAAKQEAEYRARQYNNNAEALAMAVTPEESPINSLLNHVQNLHKASKTFLIKAPSDAEKQAEKDAKASNEVEKESKRKQIDIKFEDNLDTRDFLGEQGYSPEEITNFKNQKLLHNKEGDKPLSHEDALKNVVEFLDKNKKPKTFTDSKNKQLQALHSRRNNIISKHEKNQKTFNTHKEKVYQPIKNKVDEWNSFKERYTKKTREEAEKRRNLPPGSLKAIDPFEGKRMNVLRNEVMGMDGKKRLHDQHEEAYKKLQELSKDVGNTQKAVDALNSNDYKEWVRQQTNKTENKPKDSTNKKTVEQKKTTKAVDKKGEIKTVSNKDKARKDTKVNFNTQEARDRAADANKKIQAIKDNYPDDHDFGRFEKPEDVSSKDHLENLYNLEMHGQDLTRANRDFELRNILDKGKIPSAYTGDNLQGSVTNKFLTALKDKHGDVAEFDGWNALENDAKQKIWNEISDQLDKDRSSEAKKTEVSKDTYIHLLASGLSTGDVNNQRDIGELHNKTNGNKLSINQLNRKFSGFESPNTEKEFSPDYDKETFEQPVAEEPVVEEPAKEETKVEETKDEKPKNKKSTSKKTPKPKVKKPKVEEKVEEKIEEDPSGEPEQSTGDDEKKSQHINNIMNHMFGDDQDSDQAKMMREHLEDSSHKDVASEHKSTVIAGIKQQAAQAMKDKDTQQAKEQKDSAAAEQKLITGDDHEDVTARQKAAMESKGNQYVTGYDKETGKYTGKNLPRDDAGKIKGLDSHKDEDLDVKTGPPNPEIIPQMFAQGYVWHEETRHWIKKENLDELHGKHSKHNATLANGSHESKGNATFLHPSSTPNNKIGSKGQFVMANGHTHQLGVGTTGKALQHSLSQGGHLNSHNTSGRGVSTFKDFRTHHANAGTNVHSVQTPVRDAYDAGRAKAQSTSLRALPGQAASSVASKFLSGLGLGGSSKPDFEKSLDLHKARVEALERLKKQV